MLIVRKRFPHHLRYYCQKGPTEAIDVAYKVYGDIGTVSDSTTPPVIVMHCFMGFKRTLHSVCDVFHKTTNPRRTIIALDARNHGDSPHTSSFSYFHLAEDLKHFLAKYNIKRASLLGHSMGGRTAMYFALNYPNLVEKIIVADISPTSNSPDLKLYKNFLKSMQLVSFPNKNVEFSTARSHLEKQLSETVNDKDMRDFLLTNLMRDDNGSYKWRVNTSTLLKEFDKLLELQNFSGSQFNGPVLFMFGSKSDFVERDPSNIKKIFPQAKFTEVPNAGHWLQYDNPRVFLENCIKFLNES